MLWKNSKLLFSHTPSLIGGCIGAVGFAFVLWYFSNNALMKGNYGIVYFSLDYIINIFITLLFGLFVASFIYRRSLFWRHEKRSGLGVVWGFLGALVSGCPACSVSFASYLWLASLIALLPYHWLELKIISLCLLVYTVRSQITTLTVCAVRKR
jgi:hypothetical protein